MRFMVGPWTYRVRFNAAVMDDEHGRSVDSRCCWTDREFWLWDGLLPDQRLEELVFHVMVAWEHHLGAPGGTITDRSKRYTSVAIDFWKQFSRQGGIQRLAAMTASDDDAPIRVPIAAPAEHPNCCPRCGGHAEMNEPVEPHFSTRFDRLVFDPTALCERCNINFTWTEAATTLGSRTGIVLAGPIIQPGSASRSA